MNGTNKEKRADKRKIWQELLNCWRESGLTAKQFCREHELKESDLRNWRYRFNKEQRDQHSIQKSTNVNPSKKFIPVILSGAEPVKDSSIDIIFGKNTLIRIPKNFDEEMLLRLFLVFRRSESC